MTTLAKIAFNLANCSRKQPFELARRLTEDGYGGFAEPDSCQLFSVLSEPDASGSSGLNRTRLSGLPSQTPDSARHMLGGKPPVGPKFRDSAANWAMRLIRFVVAELNPESGVEDGIFGLAYELRDSPEVDISDRDLLAQNLAWFEKNLETPSRFNRTKSKGFYRRNTRGIAWFKDGATEHLARMHKIKRVLEQYGHPVVMVSESRVGYVIYEDAFQIVAEPFSDTQTG